MIDNAIIGISSARRSAAFYKARFVPGERAGHNQMEEASFHENSAGSYKLRLRSSVAVHH